MDFTDMLITRIGEPSTTCQITTTTSAPVSTSTSTSSSTSSTTPATTTISTSTSTSSSTTTTSTTSTTTTTPTTTTTTTRTSTGTMCPTMDWSLFEGHCYFFSTTMATWADAKTACMMTPGANLASITGEAERSFLSNYMISATGTCQTYWIGGTTTGTGPTDFTWDDGSTVYPYPCSSVLYPIFWEDHPENDYILENYFEINTRLVNKLFKGYLKQLPAVYLSERNHLRNRPMQVNLTLNYCALLSINQEQQGAEFIIEFQTNWTDPRLRWNVSDFHGIESITVVKEDTVWIPDVVPFDTFDYTDTMPLDQQSIDITYDGTVSIYKSTVINFICLLDLNEFPFDTQNCYLYISSYNYPSSVLNIVATIEEFPMGPDGFTGNGEWTVTNITVYNDFYIGVPDMRPYSNPIFTFSMKRSRTYYVLLIILPSFILSLLCIIGLFWKRVDVESYMENLNLGFAAILALMFVLQTVTQDMPKMNGTDKLSIYLLVNLTIIALAIIVVMFVAETTKVKVSNKKEPSRMSQVICILWNRLNFLFMLVFSIATVINFAVLFG